MNVSTCVYAMCWLFGCVLYLPLFLSPPPIPASLSLSLSLYI